jgi:hypothetical protein
MGEKGIEPFSRRIEFGIPSFLNEETPEGQAPRQPLAVSPESQTGSLSCIFPLRIEDAYGFTPKNVFYFCLFFILGF